jgi:monoamine oxidase
MDTLYDVVVVGAGYAGLIAARQLKQAGKKIKLLEARERVGGRIHTHYLSDLDDTTYLDLGGQWIGPSQDKMYELAKEFNVETFQTYDKGKSILAFGNRLKTYSGTIPRLSFIALFGLNKIINKLEKLAKTVNLDTPWETPNAAEWDAITLASFINKETGNKDARTLINAGLETVFACKSSEISLLFALFYIKSGTSLECLLGTIGGAQQDRFIGGAQLIAQRIAATLENELQLNSPVKKVEQSKEEVLIKGDGFSIRAKKVIIAIPPTLASRIDYQPILPASRDQLTQRVPMGTVIKCYAIYERPFWRDKGLSGQAVTDENFQVQTVFDNSPHDASKGMLMGFCLADRARPLMDKTEAERKDIIIENFVRLFGEEAANPIYYIDKSWANEEWSRGCYTGLLTPGTMTSYKNALREPCGHIHWAGTETATVWNGYIDGAVRSGERAAQEVLAFHNHKNA